ncbi:MAG: hypothetical protein U5K55_16240 [Aliarcobacter sp.]|nr:hypothetical protein [Aliarcobacter sp.]
MSKDSYILMVFEGEYTEPQILENLKKYFLNESDKKIVKAVYGTVIYSLYEEFFICGEFDEDLDLFTIIKEKLESNGSDELNDILREQVPEIYLFFDYDGHATNANLEKLQKILELFNNETENGKLYVSYPMVEAIKHLKEGIDFEEIIEESNSSYKELVSQNCDEHLCHLRNFSFNDWDRIIQEHSKKANFIVSDEFLFPNEIFEQFEIFTHQKQKFIEPHNKIAVLASFPLFLLDYYGIKKFIKDEKVIEE